MGALARVSKRIAVVSAVAAALLAGAGSAQAATGDLSFKDCIAKFVSGPCTAVPNEVLEGARDVAVSPNGKFVFVADYEDSIQVFGRSGVDGSLTYLSCLDNGEDSGCTEMPRNRLLAPVSLAVSPDGASLYVAAETSDDVVRLGVGADGALSFQSCVEDDDLFDSGCGSKAALLDLPQRVAVSPKDGHVYAISGSTEGVALNHFSPSLAPVGCYVEVVGSSGCTQLEPLLGPKGLAVSPDGKFVYVTSVGRDAIGWFKRGESGALTFAGCVDDGDDSTQFTDACAEDKLPDYDILKHLAFAPGGSQVYVTDEIPLGAVYHFSRDETTGALTRQDCYANDVNVDVPGCTELNDATGSALAGVTDAVVSPDSANLYTVAIQDAGLSTFGLNGGGALSFIRCLSAGGGTGCTLFGESVFSGPFGLALSPDGHDLYVANSFGVPALLHFEREAPGTREGGEGPGPGPGPGPEGGSGAPGGGQPGGPAPGAGQEVKCGGRTATKVGTARSESIAGTPKRDVIAAGPGNDTVRGLGGEDLLCGEGGRDTLLGGAKDDTLIGGPGRDILKGAAGKDKLIGGPGKDLAKQ